LKNFSTLHEGNGWFGADNVVVPSILLVWMGRSSMQLAWPWQLQPFWQPLQD